MSEGVLERGEAIWERLRTVFKRFRCPLEVSGKERLEVSWKRFRTRKNNDFVAYIWEKSLISRVHYSKVKIVMCMLTEQFLAALWKRVEVFWTSLDRLGGVLEAIWKRLEVIWSRLEPLYRRLQPCRQDDFAMYNKPNSCLQPKILENTSEKRFGKCRGASWGLLDRLGPVLRTFGDSLEAAGDIWKASWRRSETCKNNDFDTYMIKKP